MDADEGRVQFFFEGGDGYLAGPNGDGARGREMFVPLVEPGAAAGGGNGGEE